MLKVSDYKENDKILWIFTDVLGKISVIARGAKKSKSKFFSVTLPLCFGEYMVYKGKGMYTLNEGQIIESFQELLNDLDTLTYASYVCELIDISMVEEESNRELFRIMVSTLYLLKSKAIDYEMLIRAYELNVLKYTGYHINFNQCSFCHRRIESSSYISFQYHGGICGECVRDNNGIGVSKAAFNVLKFLNNTPLENIYRLNVSEDVKNEIKKILFLFISNNYSKIPKSLQMLDFIKEVEQNE